LALRDGQWRAGMPEWDGATDRLQRMALAAAAGPWLALGDQVASGRGGRVALAFGDPKGDCPRWGDMVSGGVFPGDFPALWPGGLAGRLARGLSLPAGWWPCPVAGACSTGLIAVLAAADLIEQGQCVAGLAGAADAGLTPLVLGGFAALGVLCGTEAPGSEPCAGFAPAEGAGCVALARAQAPADGTWRLRAGFRFADASHPTRCADVGVLRAGLAGLWESGAPDAIVVHGTGTVAGEAYEGAALDDGPWRDAPRVRCKEMLGHHLGASAAVELAVGLEMPVRRFWKLSQGFGGHVAGVMCERW
jgi:3-oxoacyl-[acyl-carrier-protein] synthase II